MTTNPDNTMGHNAKARADVIRSAVKEVSRLDAEIKALQTERTTVKNKLVKGDLGMKIADFNVALRLYNLEGDDRDRLLDTIRESFHALGIGEQSSFLKAMDGQEAGEARGRRKKPKPEDLGETVNQLHTESTTDAEFEAAAPA